MAIGALAGAGASLAGILSESKANAARLNLSYLSLFEQKRQARERERLAKSSRTDAYGNSVNYVPGQGFVTDVTPLTKAILASQQKEQLAQFRDDAPRQRAAAERMDKRSIQAADEYDDKFNKHKYSRKRSKEEYVAEAIRNAIAARQGGSKENTSDISRLALRTGNSATLAKMLASARKKDSGQETLAQAIAKAKAQGAQQYFAETGANNQLVFSELNQLKSTADQTTGAQLNWNNENAALSGRQDNALSGLIQTNAANSQAVGNAYNQAANAAGQSPNYSGLASALSGIKLPSSGKTQSPQEKMLADLLMKQRIGSAQIGIHNNNNTLSAFKGNSALF